MCEKDLNNLLADTDDLLSQINNQDNAVKNIQDDLNVAVGTISALECLVGWEWSLARVFCEIEVKALLNIGPESNFIRGSESRLEDAWQNKNTACFRKPVLSDNI